MPGKVRRSYKVSNLVYIPNYELIFPYGQIESSQTHNDRLILDIKRLGNIYISYFPFTTPSGFKHGTILKM